MFPCQAPRGAPTPLVTWFRGGKLVVEGPGRKIQVVIQNQRRGYHDINSPSPLRARSSLGVLFRGGRTFWSGERGTLHVSTQLTCTEQRMSSAFSNLTIHHCQGVTRVAQTASFATL